LGAKAENNQNLAEYIFNKSAGNPFFAIQILRELVENKALSWKEAGWETDWEILGKIPVSGTMLNTILRRIENLTPAQNDLLCKGAVIGREFEIELLYHLTDLSRATVVTSINELINQQLLERSSAKGKVLFAHDRVRDAFYQQITETQKRQIHLQIAGAIEYVKQDLDEVIFELAHHYAESGEREKTLQYVLPAADRAFHSWANEEAIKYYKIAIDILESKKLRNQDWFHAQEHLIQLCLTVGKFEEAIAFSEQLLPLIANPFDKARIYKKLGATFGEKGDWTQCVNNTQKGLTILGEKLPRNDFAMIACTIIEFAKHLLLGLYFSLLGGWRPKRRVKDEDREIVKLYNNLTIMFRQINIRNFHWIVLRMLNISEIRIGESFELGLSQLTYGSILLNIPLLDKSIKYSEKALHVNTKLNNEWGITVCLHFLNVNHSMAGKSVDSIRYGEQAAILNKKVGDIDLEGHILEGLGVAHYYISDYPRAIQCFEQRLKISRKLKNFFYVSNALIELAICYIEKNNFQKAREMLGEAQNLSVEHKLWAAYYSVLYHTGYLELESNNYQDALNNLAQSKKIFEEHHLMELPNVVPLSLLADAQIAWVMERYIHMNTPIPKPKLAQIHRLCRIALKKTKPWPNQYGGALRAMANYCRMSGKNHLAQRYFLQSIRHDQSAGRKYELAKGYFEYGNFLESLQQNIAAKENWRKAHDIFVAIGAVAYAQKTGILLDDNQKEAAIMDETTAKDRLKLERRMNAVLNISRYISSTLDITELLERILDGAMELLGAETGILLLYPEAGPKYLEVKVSRKISMEEYQRPGFAPSRSIIARVEKEKTSLIIMDASADETFKNQSSVVLRGIRSVICAPLMNKDQLLGIIYLDHSLLGGLFAEDDLKILESISSQASVSIENARLYSQVIGYSKEIQESNIKIARWNQELEASVLERTSQLNERNTRLEKINVQLAAANAELASANQQIRAYAAKIEELTLEKERTRFARDAHDSVGRTMSISLALLEACDALYEIKPQVAKEKLAEAINMSRKGMKELRNSIFNMTATRLTSDNLCNALKDLILEYQVSGMKVELRIEGETSCREPRFFDVIYRVCQEALTNSLRHGKAQNVSITVRLDNHLISASIADDGHGSQSIQHGLGLAGMEQRVENLGGTITYGSEAETGFRVYFELPVS
jgi:signal transduction histidine kinase/tetratricopeptide (TPR) repeat protein